MVHILSMRSPIYRVDIVLASHLSARVIVIAYLNVKVVTEPDVVRNAVEAFEIICSDFKDGQKRSRRVKSVTFYGADLRHSVSLFHWNTRFRSDAYREEYLQVFV